MRPLIFNVLNDKVSSEALLQKLYVCRHPSLPLTLYCYNKKKKVKSDFTDAVDECRGLVLENATLNTVAWSLNAFPSLPGTEKAVFLGGSRSRAAETRVCYRVETKEDGSMLTLFHYREWMLCTRHTFCEFDEVYQRGFLEAVQCATLNEFAQKCALRTNVTYAFELCSLRNRIVRRYDEPTVFLLAGHERETHRELSCGELDELVGRYGVTSVRRPHAVDNVSIEDVRCMMSEAERNHELFEGFVLRPMHVLHVRMKVKSRVYKAAHDLRYRGWVKATPRLLLPLVARGYEHVLALIDECRRDGAELRSRWQLVKDVLQRSGKVIDANLDWEATSAIAEELFAEPDVVNGIEWKHDCLACRADACYQKPADDTDGLASAKPVAPSKKGGDQMWKVWCYCGNEMQCVRLKHDNLYTRRCICGVAFEVLIYGTGTLLWMCDACGCTHESHQQATVLDGNAKDRGQPLGVPASEECKKLRLHAHWLMAKAQERYGLSKSDIYRRLCKILKLPGARMHMAVMGMTQCLRVIRVLETDPFSTDK